MISIPTVVNRPTFALQLDLLWHQHKKIYGPQAWRKVLAAVINRNEKTDSTLTKLPWDIGVPYAIVDSFHYFINLEDVNYTPLNTIVGLYQVLQYFDDEEVLEIIDCDQFHMYKHPQIKVGDNELIVDAVSEEWFLKSTSQLSFNVTPWLSSQHGIWNGGWMPIIGKAKTFKTIMVDWIQYTKKCFLTIKEPNQNWWSSMYGFQIACANNKIKMTHKEMVYLPGFNSIKPEHYICHYSVDQKYKKWEMRTIDDIKQEQFEDNLFYNSIKEWIKSKRGHI